MKLEELDEIPKASDYAVGEETAEYFAAKYRAAISRLAYAKTQLFEAQELGYLHDPVLAGRVRAFIEKLNAEGL